LAYTWDANKLKSAEIDNYNALTSNYYLSYDKENRLKGWMQGSNAINQSWDLSLCGDWLEFTSNANGSSINDIRNYNPSHQLLYTTSNLASSTLLYDNNGNLLKNINGHEYQWDYENRLMQTSINGNTIYYAYDALGRRVSKTCNGNSNTYVVADFRDIQEYDNNVLKRSFVYGSYIDE
jgi:YD repeat-containing protein